MRRSSRLWTTPRWKSHQQACGEECPQARNYPSDNLHRFLVRADELCRQRLTGVPFCVVPTMIMVCMALIQKLSAKAFARIRGVADSGVDRESDLAWMLCCVGNACTVDSRSGKFRLSPRVGNLQRQTGSELRVCSVMSSSCRPFLRRSTLWMRMQWVRGHRPWRRREEA